MNRGQVRRPHRSIINTGDRSPEIFRQGEIYGLGRRVGRGLADGPDLGVGVGRGVAVGDARWPLAVVAVGVCSPPLAVGVGVGVPPPTAARISTRPQP